MAALALLPANGDGEYKSVAVVTGEGHAAGIHWEGFEEREGPASAAF